MRLLTHRLHRAFPELDRYDDERCGRFVRAAAGGWVRQGARWTACLAAGGVCLAGGVWLAVVLLERLSINFVYNEAADVVALIVWAILGVVLIGVGPLAMFVARDVLLRRRVRHVLRAKGTCASCRYSLVGLPIGDAMHVICPECGLEGRVDPSLGELVRDEQGQARFKPAPARPPRVFTARRVRWLRRWGIRAAVAIAIGAPTAWGGYEVFLRRQAAVAQRERPGPAGVTALMESWQPPGAGPDDPNAWDAYDAAITVMASTDARVWRNAPPTTSRGDSVYPEFSYVLDPDAIGKETGGGYRQEQDAMSAALALRLIEDYRADGLYDQFRLIAQRQRSVRPLSHPATQPLYSTMLPNLGKSRQFARINAARLMLARRDGDIDEFADALEAGLAIARIEQHEFPVISHLVGIAIEGLCFVQVREVLAAGPTEEWLDAIEGAMLRQSHRVDPARLMEGERLTALDSIGWVFADHSRARGGRYSAGVRTLNAEEMPGRLGTWSANRDAVNAWYDRFAVVAAHPRSDRAVPDLSDGEAEGLMLVAYFSPALGKAMQAVDQIELDWRGLRVLIAIERFRLRTGQYPQELGDLGAGVLAELPSDPWSGKPFGYRRIDPGADAQGRSYLLYAVAADGIDNGGAMPARSPEHAAPYYLLHAPSTPEKVAFDLIVNDRYR